jgi:uncharacterized protein with NRDE domain
MCVAAIAWNAHPDWPLVAVGNRDELHERASAPLARWDDGSGIIAGRDLVAGGTWLGVHEAGRFALVTNYRVPEGPQPGRLSRGGLVTDLLRGRGPGEIGRMNAFNLFHTAGGPGIGEARFLTNHPAPRSQPLAPGIHGLSNGGFDDPWRKTRAVRAIVSRWLEGGGTDGAAPMLAALRDDTPLPAVGSGPDPAYSSVFIADPVYGTRCSTVVAVHRSGRGTITERRFGSDCAEAGETEIGFVWEAG